MSISGQVTPRRGRKLGGVPHRCQLDEAAGVFALRLARCDIERAACSHLPLDPLHRASADTARLGNRQHALSGPQLETTFPARAIRERRPSCKPGMNSLFDHAPLKLGKRARELKHQATGRVRRAYSRPSVESGCPYLAASPMRGDRAASSNEQKGALVSTQYRPLLGGGPT
jgi:hypothetical protein